MTDLLFLGPQQPSPSVGRVLDKVVGAGPVCIVTAGWQEREGETEELAGLLGRDITDLMLYHRADNLPGSDPALLAAHRQRQQRLQDLQRLYRLRLAHALAAADALIRFGNGVDPRLVAAERRGALAAVRALDRHHLGQLRRIHRDFQQRWQPAQRPAVARQSNELAGIIGRSRALLIAGGHVGVLISRLRLFGIHDLLGQTPVIAWSAGAMALAQRIVLFHDHPPQGPNDPEVFDAGLGLARNIVPLPHARRRLDLEDAPRMALLAARFAPARCVTLEPDSLLHWRAGELLRAESVQRLDGDGRLAALEHP